jgi:hypothetical protein
VLVVNSHNINMGIVLPIANKHYLLMRGELSDNNIRTEIAKQLQLHKERVTSQSRGTPPSFVIHRA